MGQIARPSADLGNDGWTEEPLFSKLNAITARPPGVLYERRGVDQRIVRSPQDKDRRTHGIERLVRRPLGDEHGFEDRRERRGRARHSFRSLAGHFKIIEPHVDLRA